MKSIAIIPLRKGSKGIPGKNKKKLVGRSLFQWVLGEAILSRLDHIYVYTDDDEIRDIIEQEYHWTEKVKYWERSSESATDTASTEFCLNELSEKINYDFDILMLLQATSPLTSAVDINRCIEKIIQESYDSALTVVRTKRFIWNVNGESLNYDYLSRPRRQDFDGLLIENGAAYAIKKEVYLKTKNRLGGKIGLVEMPEDSLVEIDEPEDWNIVEQILKSRLIKSKSLEGKIKWLILDVDGVFTPGTVFVGNEGELAKSFSLRDGMGFELAREAGISILVMTSENSAIVDQRMNKLKVQQYYKGVKDKFSLLNHLLSQLKVTRGEIAYIGDDVNDMANMLNVKWSFAPGNAADIVKREADWVLHNNGGDLAIREAIEMIIKLNKRN